MQAFARRIVRSGHRHPLIGHRLALMAAAHGPALRLKISSVFPEAELLPCAYAHLSQLDADSDVKHTRPRPITRQRKEGTSFLFCRSCLANDILHRFQTRPMERGLPWSDESFAPPRPAIPWYSLPQYGGANLLAP